MDMSRDLKYEPLLRQLFKRPLFTAEEAAAMGVPSHALTYLVRLGKLERIGRGAYRSADWQSDTNPIEEELGLTASLVRDGVICLISALDLHHLTDQIPRERWIAVPNSRRAPKVEGARVVRMRNIELGRITISIGEYRVDIFDRERTVVDAFRHLEPEIAIKALQAYLEQGADLPKLRRYAKILRVNLTPYILALTV
jgi:predicted transcriptional regulator of viral defense system